jgi:hypothetical protein
MLQKFKITSYAFILCLFRLTLTAVLKVFGADSAAFFECQKLAFGKTNKEATIKFFEDLAQCILILWKKWDNIGQLAVVLR